MNKILLSLVTISLVSLVAVGATKAYFSDTETSTGNSFTAGKLDLVLGAGNPIPFSVTNLVPGQSGTGTVTLTNTNGSIDGVLDVKIANLVQAENGLTDPEIKAGDYENGGDLHLFMQFAAFVDVNKNGIFDAGDIQLTYDGQKRAYPGFWSGDFHYAGISGMMNGGWNDIMTMTAGQSVDLVVMWQFPSNSTGYSDNLAMTDSLGFDVQTSLEQVGALTGGVAD